MILTCDEECLETLGPDVATVDTRVSLKIAHRPRGAGPRRQSGRMRHVALQPDLLDHHSLNLVARRPRFREGGGSDGVSAGGSRYDSAL